MDEFMTTEEAAAEAAVSAPTIRRWIAEGALRARRVGGRYLVDANDLHGLLEELADDDDEEVEDDDEECDD